MKTHPNYGEALTGPALKRAAIALVLLLGAALLAPQRAHAQSVVLNTEDISNFTQVGGQLGVTPGTPLRFDDASGADVTGLSASAPFVAFGTTVDLIATFQLIPGTFNGNDAGFQLAINDGDSNRAAIAAAIMINGTPHIGLVGQGERNTLLGYPAFIQVDWQAAPLTLHLRRWADGSAEILELNGAAPSQRTFISASQVSGKTREGPTVELGLFSGSATLIAEVTEFRAFTVSPIPEPETYAMLLAGLGLLGFAARRRKLKEAAATAG